MSLLTFWTGAMPTTAALTKVTTGTVIKTLLQIKNGAILKGRPVEWGISFDGSAAATPIECELIQTDVAATVTAYAEADIVKADPNEVAALGNILAAAGTTASGFNASAEGTVANTRLFDYQLVAPTGGFVKQLPLGREMWLDISKWLRVRVTAGAAVNAVAYVTMEY